MAGHSHWAGIKHKKGKADNLKSKIFSKLSKEITVAAKLGSRDPSMNPRLRSAIESAKEANVPKDVIERAVKKSEMDPNINYSSIIYEGFGPEKIAVVVEALTDNKNRTASNIRTIFQKAGGSLGTQGSASHNFNQTGVIKINKDEISEEKILELAIEAGADECINKDSNYEIQCSVNEIYNVKKNLENKVNNFISTKIEWLPINSVKVADEQQEKLIEFFETLEEDDDVQNIFSNVKFKTE